MCRRILRRIVCLPLALRVHNKILASCGNLLVGAAGQSPDNLRAVTRKLRCTLALACVCASCYKLLRNVLRVADGALGAMRGNNSLSMCRNGLWLVDCHTVREVGPTLCTVPRQRPPP